jgi:hypothetical protein
VSLRGAATPYRPSAAMIPPGASPSPAALTTSYLAHDFWTITLTSKGKTPLHSHAALGYIDQVAVWPAAATDFKWVHHAIESSVGSMLSSLMPCSSSLLRARERNHSTEDLQAGQESLGVRIVNPFQP